VASISQSITSVSARLFVSLAELVADGVPIQPGEAVAVVRHLCDLLNRPGALVPTPGEIHLLPDGELFVATGHGRPGAALPLLVQLLRNMLDRAPLGQSASPALCHIVARGLGLLSERPFDTVRAFGDALCAFEGEDPVSDAQALFERWQTACHVADLAPALTPPLQIVVLDATDNVPIADDTRVVRPKQDRRRFPRVSVDVDQELPGAMWTSGPPLPAAEDDVVALTYRRRWVSIVAVFLTVLIPVGWSLVNWPPPVTSKHDAAGSHPPAAVIGPPPSTVSDMSEEPAEQEEPAESAGSVPMPSRQRATAPRMSASAKGVGERPRARQWTAVPVADNIADVTPASFEPIGEPDSADSFASNNSAIFLPDSDRADAGLHVMRIADDGARNYHVRPSPDGTSVAFDSDRGGTRGIFVANRDGTNVHRVSGPGYAALPTWSPDGGRIAFVKADDRDDTVWNLWILELATGASRQVSFHGAGRTSSGSWFPDGHRICYSHQSRLLIVDLTTGHRREFTSPRGRVGAATVSPNGRRIVFKAGGGGTWLLNLDQDGETRRILDDPSAEEFSWAPEGDRLAYFSRRENNWVVWVEGPR
jgi:hypothetical protein